MRLTAREHCSIILVSKGRNKMTYTAHVQFVPAYFNRVAYANIPARWTGDVDTNGARVQADEATRDDCIAYLIAELKARGLTGRLRVVGE
jgi:hypothetical protein